MKEELFTNEMVIEILKIFDEHVNNYREMEDSNYQCYIDTFMKSDFYKNTKNKNNEKTTMG